MNINIPGFHLSIVIDQFGFWYVNADWGAS